MLRPVKKAAVSTKNFVVKHKTPIVAAAAVVTTVVVMNKLRGGALNDHLEFLAETGQTDKYLTWIADNTNV